MSSQRLGEGKEKEKGKDSQMLNNSENQAICDYTSGDDTMEKREKLEHMKVVEEPILDGRGK